MASGGMAHSISVSDARRRFEQLSEEAGSGNVIHESLRKSKPTLSKRVTSPNISQQRSSSGSSEQARSLSPSKKSPLFKRNSASSIDSKKVNRASSDADVLESKRSKYQSSKMDDKKSNSVNTSPTASGGKRGSGRKRREPPKPPTQPDSPDSSPLRHTPLKQDSPTHGKTSSPAHHKSVSKERPTLKGRQNGEDRERPPRPPSPKKVVRDKDLEISLAGESVDCVAASLAIWMAHCLWCGGQPALSVVWGLCLCPACFGP